MTSSNTEKADISRVVTDGLCHSCGACSGICPDEAIGFTERPNGLLFPAVDPDKCSQCGLCLAVCPGWSMGEDMIELLPEDPFTGRSIRSFVGKSNDDRIYADSQSGGIATELILHALRSGDISGAVVVTMGPGIPPRPAAHLATKEEEILSARRSKYSPVPVLEVIKQLDRTGGPVAVVGLSCHIHGLIKASESFPELKERVRYRIGLICNHSLSSVSIDYLAMKAGFDIDTEKDLIFRDKSCCGYPGDVRVSSKDGRSVILKKINKKRINPYLTPPRCHMCFDKMNVLSDVTIGDPHGISSVDRKNGESICIARNTRGLELVESLIDSGRVSLREIPYSDITRGQKIDRKRGAWRGFCEEWQALGRPVPDYYPSIRKHAGTVDGHSHGSVAKALSLISFTDRKELLDWLEKNERKDLLLYKLRNVYTYFLLAARKSISILRRGQPG